MATNSNTTKEVTLHKHHFIRTPIAALFGSLALLLIILSVVLFWTNKTITNTDSYVSTVGPLASKPAVQTFVSEEVSRAIVKDAPVEELAVELLDESERINKTSEELSPLVESALREEALLIVARPSSAQLWENSNRSIHQSLITQLNSESNSLQFDFKPIIDEAVLQLKGTKLEKLSEEISVEPGKAVVTVDGSAMQSVNRAYKSMKNSIIALIGLAIVFLALAVLISVHHVKTFRRVAVASGVALLIIYVLLSAPQYVSVGETGEVSAELIKSISSTVLTGLKSTVLISGFVLVLAALGSKIVEIVLHKRK